MKILAAALIAIFLSVGVGRVAKCETPAEKAVEATQRSAQLNNEAMAALKRGDTRGAQRLINSAVALIDYWPEDHTTPILMLWNAGAIANANGNRELATDFRERTLRRARNFMPLLLDTNGAKKANQYREQGDHLSAAAELIKVVDATDRFIEKIKQLDPAPAQAVEVESNKAVVLLLVGQEYYLANDNERSTAEKSAKYLSEAKRLCDRSSKNGSAVQFKILTTYGLVLDRRLGRSEEARGVLEEALAIARAIYPANDHRVGGAHSNLSQVYAKLGNGEYAINHCDAALLILKRSSGTEGREFYYNTALDCVRTYFKFKSESRILQLKSDVADTLKSDAAQCKLDIREPARAWSDFMASIGEKSYALQVLRDTTTSVDRLCRK